MSMGSRMEVPMLAIIAPTLRQVDSWERSIGSSVIRDSSVEFEEVGTRIYQYVSHTLPEGNLIITIECTDFGDSCLPVDLTSEHGSPALIDNLLPVGKKG